MISALAEEAAARDLRFVMANFAATAKNAPAHDFLESIGAQYRMDGGYRFPVTALIGLKPRSAAIRTVPQSAKRKPSTPHSHKRPDYHQIARELSTAAQVHEAMRAEFTPAAIDGSMNETEAKLAAIWCDLLKRPSVPLSGNFFDLGGHSLLAVALIVRVKEDFDIELPIDDVYAAGLTLGDLARNIEARLEGAPPVNDAEYYAILRELESLSDEEVERLLAEDSGVA